MQFVIIGNFNDTFDRMSAAEQQKGMEAEWAKSREYYSKGLLRQIWLFKSLLHNRLRERRGDVFWCASVLTGLAKRDSIIALPRHGSSDGAPFSQTGTTPGFPAPG